MTIGGAEFGMAPESQSWQVNLSVSNLTKIDDHLHNFLLLQPPRARSTIP